MNNLEYKHNRVYDKNDVSGKKCNLTSTKPCIVLTIIKTIGCRLLAPGTNKLRKDEQKIAVPKILFAGYLDAKNPPGTCVTRYPQKNDESTALSIPTDHV